MLKFEYEIRLNDEGRPYIYLPNTYQDKVEDKFMALELTMYLLVQLLDNRKDTLPEDQVQALKKTLENVGMISDELAMLLKKQMEAGGEFVIASQRNYHFTVDDEKELFSLSPTSIIRNGKIFKREPGLKVLVLENMRIYQLVDGIDNENWKKI